MSPKSGSRKSPRHHTVHTKHSRYAVNNYPRGSDRWLEVEGDKIDASWARGEIDNGERMDLEQGIHEAGRDHLANTRESRREFTEIRNEVLSSKTEKEMQAILKRAYANDNLTEGQKTELAQNARARIAFLPQGGKTRPARPNNSMLSEGMSISIDRESFDSGDGPLDTSTQKRLGLIEVDLPEDPYGPMGIYRSIEGQLWQVLWDEPKNRAELYKFEG